MRRDAALFALVLVVMTAACDAGPQDDAALPDTTRLDGNARADSAVGGAGHGVVTPGGAAAIPPRSAHHFDPGTLAAGDTFLNLRVVNLDVRRVFEDSVWAGSVRFSGALRLSGVYQRHFDWPEPEALCFHIDEESAERVPEFAPDAWTSPGMKSWFCFTDAEAARERLGSAETPLRAVIVVDGYLVVREFTDAWDTARLVRVDSVLGAARATLRDP